MGAVLPKLRLHGADQPLAWLRLPASALVEDAALGAHWDHLNACGRDLPFLSATVVGTALRVFGRGSEQLLLAQQGGQVVALLLLLRHSRGWITFQPSQLPLGACVIDPAVPLGELLHGLMRGPLGWCPTLSLTQLDPWLLPRPAQDGLTRCTDYIATAWIDVDGRFEDYWNARGKNLRQNMRKQRNRLTTSGIDVATRVLTRPEDMPAAVERYGQLEGSGWKCGQGTAVHSDNAQGRFYRELLQAAAARGEAVVYEGLFGAHTAAMNLCLRRGTTLVVLKTAYDSAIEGNYSPASLLHQDLVEHVFNDGSIRRIEYYGRLMEWHTRWTAQQRVLYHLTRYRWSLLKSFSDWRRARLQTLQRPGEIDAQATAPLDAP